MDKYYCEFGDGSELIYGYVDWLDMTLWYCPVGDFYDVEGKFPPPVTP